MKKKKINFLLRISLIAALSLISLDSSHANIIKKELTYLWNDPLVSVPLLASTALSINYTIKDGIKLYNGDFKNKSLGQIAKESWKTLAAQSAMLTFGALSLYRRKAVERKIAEEYYAYKTVKEAGYSHIPRTVFRNGDYHSQYNKEVFLDKRIIVQHNALKQNDCVSCGEYSAYFAKCLLHKDYNGLFDRDKFEKQRKIWGKEIKNLRGPGIHDKKLRSDEIAHILKKDRKQICVIDNLEALELMIENKCFESEPEIKNLRNFKKNKKKPLICIVNNADGVSFSRTQSNKLWHIVTIMVEYVDSKTLQLTVIDPLYDDTTKSHVIDSLCHIITNVLE